MLDECESCHHKIEGHCQLSGKKKMLPIFPSKFIGEWLLFVECYKSSSCVYTNPVFEELDLSLNDCA